jgi:hypothetical protein
MEEGLYKYPMKNILRTGDPLHKKKSNIKVDI